MIIILRGSRIWISISLVSLSTIITTNYRVSLYCADLILVCNNRIHIARIVEVHVASVAAIKLRFWQMTDGVQYLTLRLEMLIVQTKIAHWVISWTFWNDNLSWLVFQAGEIFIKWL